MCLFEAAVSYVDERLSWVPEEFDGAEEIHVRRDTLWQPDVAPIAWFVPRWSRLVLMRMVSAARP